MIWINGPFGVGKTQLAFELHDRLEGSFVFDPEEIGFTIRRLTPPSQQRSDFQDYPLWRQMVIETLRHSSKGEEVLIVPMTLVNPEYFDEILSTLRRSGLTVHHVALLASKETVLKRLKKRGEGSKSWAAEQLDRCLEGLSQLDHIEQLKTDDLSVTEVADKVAERFDLQLKPAKSPLKRRFYMMKVQFKHIRRLK